MLYLIPAFLTPESPDLWVTEFLRNLVAEYPIFFAENTKTARKVLREILPEIQQNRLELYEFNKNSSSEDFDVFVAHIQSGKKVVYLSEAGMPCIADPGNKLVSYCHLHATRVVPVSGPSSILLALISSGFNGQEFSFHGYLPIEKSERRAKIKSLESLVLQTNYTQIFMETPYRNAALLKDLVEVLSSQTLLCIAANLQSPNSEFIKTKRIGEWKNNIPELHKMPCIFLLGAY